MTETYPYGRPVRPPVPTDPITGAPKDIKRKSKPRSVWPEVTHQMTSRTVDFHVNAIDNRWEATCKCGWESPLGTQFAIRDAFAAHLTDVGGRYG